MQPDQLGCGFQEDQYDRKETHSVKWTTIIGTYYTATALVLAGIAYHVGLLIW